VQELGYETGSEFDPGDPFGLCVLTLRSGGAADLANRHRGRERHHHATLAPGVFDQLLGHLRHAGFPETPTHVVPPGPTRRVWLRSGEAEVRTAPLAFHEAVEWPRYRELFRMLDSLVVAVSAGELRVISDPLPGLLAHL
jgi:hypothetical protein